MDSSRIAHVINTECNKEELTVEQFQKLIEEYLTKTSSQASVEVQNFSIPSFQKQLDILPIICKISKTACEKLAEFREKYSHSIFDISINIGVDESKSESYNPLEGKGIQLIEQNRDAIPWL